MTTRNVLPAGFKWMRITNAYGEEMDLVTIDQHTAEGLELMRKAYAMLDSPPKQE